MTEKETRVRELFGALRLFGLAVEDAQAFYACAWAAMLSAAREVVVRLQEDDLDGAVKAAQRLEGLEYELTGDLSLCDAFLNRVGLPEEATRDTWPPSR